MVPTDPEEDRAENIVRASPMRRSWRRFLRNRSGVVGAILILLVAVFSLASPWVVPFPQDALGSSHVENRLLPPTREHWFGTDQLGRDLFSRLVFGGRTSLLIGVLSVLSSAAIGVPFGLAAGYLTGWCDEIIMRFADVFLGVPSLVLAMLVALTLGGGAEVTVVAIAVSWWPRYARLVRGEVLRMKTLDYVEAARCCGAGPLRVVGRHIFPGTLPVLAVQASLQMGTAILVAAALGFIGLGARPPSSEWGLAVAMGREYLPDAWWPSLFPGLAIVVVVVALTMLGDGLRVALDAKAEVRM